MYLTFSTCIAYSEAVYLGMYTMYTEMYTTSVRSVMMYDVWQHQLSFKCSTMEQDEIVSRGMGFVRHATDMRVQRP